MSRLQLGGFDPERHRQTRMVFVRDLRTSSVPLDKPAWLAVKVPHYLIAGANPPKDRGKRGRRKGTRFGGKANVRHVKVQPKKNK